MGGDYEADLEALLDVDGAHEKAGSWFLATADSFGASQEQHAHRDDDDAEEKASADGMPIPEAHHRAPADGRSSGLSARGFAPQFDDPIVDALITDLWTSSEQQHDIDDQVSPFSMSHVPFRSASTRPDAAPPRFAPLYSSSASAAHAASWPAPSREFPHSASWASSSTTPPPPLYSHMNPPGQPLYGDRRLHRTPTLCASSLDAPFTGAHHAAWHTAPPPHALPPQPLPPVHAEGPARDLKRTSASITQLHHVATLPVPHMCEAVHIPFLLLRAVAAQLRLSKRGERDWEHVRKAIMLELPEPRSEELDKALKKSFKNKIKNLLSERRRQDQTSAWAELRALPSAEALFLKLREEQFASADSFPDGALRAAAGFLFAERKRASPRSLLDWPAAARDPLVRCLVSLHRAEFGSRTHALHEVAGPGLFAAGELELCVMAACRCALCTEAWALPELDAQLRALQDVDGPRALASIARGAGAGEDLTAQFAADAESPDAAERMAQDRAVLETVRLHWTKGKAALMAHILHAHASRRGEACKGVRDAQPLARGWNADDFARALRHIHPHTKCEVCTSLKKRRRTRIGAAKTWQEATRKDDYESS